MKFLVAFDSKIEQVEETSKQVGELIRRETQADMDYVDLTRRQINVLAHYDKIIIGGGVWFGKVTDAMVHFVWQNKEELLIKPVYLYFNSYNSEEKFKQIAAHDLPIEILEHAETFNLGLNVNLSEMNPIDRIKWTLTGQKVVTPYDGSMTKAFVEKIVNP